MGREAEIHVLSKDLTHMNRWAWLKKENNRRNIVNNKFSSLKVYRLQHVVK